MATLTPSLGPSSSGGRDAPFRVSTREVSADLSTVGPDQSPNELGALSPAAFATLLEKFANIPPVKLIDGDPQLVVSTKRGRFILLPSGGKLLVRPANDAQQPYVKYDPANLLGFLDATDQQTQTQAPDKNFQTLIGSAAAVVAETETTIPPTPPSAPIYGNFPSTTVRPQPASATVPSIPASARLPVTPPAPQPKKINPRLIYAVLALFAITAGGSLWVFFGPAPADKPPPTAPAGEFDLVTAPEQLASLKKRFVGTYATNGDAGGERLLEIKADGTFKYQEFGDSVARTANRSGTYTFAFRHGTKTPVIRTSGVGTIEIRDEKTLYCQSASFAKLP